jgi:hypothetical protein
MVDSMNRKLRTSTRSICLSYDLTVRHFIDVVHNCNTPLPCADTGVRDPKVGHEASAGEIGSHPM